MPIQQERGGYDPAPSPDVRGVTWTGGLSLGEVVCIVLGSGLLGGFLWIMFVTAPSRHKAEMQFMAECIEFHSEKRCAEFLRYGRADLARRTPHLKP